MLQSFTQSCLHFSVLPLNSPILYTILSAFLTFTTMLQSFTQSCLHFSVLPLYTPILYTILSAFLSFTTVCSNPLHNLVCISQFYHCTLQSFTQSCLHFSVLPLNSPILYTILSAFLSFTTVRSNPLHNLVCISQFYNCTLQSFTQSCLHFSVLPLYAPILYTILSAFLSFTDHCKF